MHSSQDISEEEEEFERDCNILAWKATKSRLFWCSGVCASCGSELELPLTSRPQMAKRC